MRCARCTCSAMADLAAELGDAALKRACERLWRDVTTAQMYVTGGLGPDEEQRRLHEDYDLPNETAYAETCASVALVFWAQRMLHLDLDGAYADMMERALYNGALTGLSREGTHYFYANPLESRGQHRRWAWHLCPCCTMNVSRLVASVGGYFLSASRDGVAFHLYGGVSAEVDDRRRQSSTARDQRLSVGRAIRIAIDPASPANSRSNCASRSGRSARALAVNGEALSLAVKRGYANLARKWPAGDVVALDLPMPAERLYAHPKVRMDVGRVALRRGPLVYCARRSTTPAPKCSASGCRGMRRSARGV